MNIANLHQNLVLWKRAMTSSEELRRERDALDSSIDGLRKWMISFTLLVSVGLFIELRTPFLEFWETCDWHALVDSAIGGMMVAAGVAGELFVEFLARRKENKLGQINGHLEMEAERQFKDADERIADAERKTAEAKLETERLKSQLAWRTVPLEKSTKLIAELATRTGSIWIEHLEGDIESQYFAKHFEKIFETAEWKVGSRSCRGNLLVFGIPCLIPPASGAIGDELFMFLMEAFMRSGIEVGMTPRMPVWENRYESLPPLSEPAFRLLIGAKQPIPG